MSSLSFTLRNFAHRHDEMPAFHAGYLVVTFLLAALLNLGAFALLIAAHMSLDYVKYSEVHGFSLKKTFQGIFFESLIDLMLLSIALVFGVYLHHYAGLIVFSGLLRAEQTIFRALGTVIPKLEILHHVYVDFTDVKIHMARVPEELKKGWTVTDKVCLTLIILSISLVLMAPMVLDLTSEIYLKILEDQLVPWNI